MPKFPKSDGFKFKNKSPFMDVATVGNSKIEETITGGTTNKPKNPRKNKPIERPVDFRGALGSFADYEKRFKQWRSRQLQDKVVDKQKIEKGLTREEFEEKKRLYGKSGEAGYTAGDVLAQTAQMGGTLGDVWWEEEEDVSVEGGGRVNPITKKSPAKRDYMTADSPTMKKSSFFKMKGWPGFTKNK